MKTSEAAFIESMDDDFNSAGALASLFELVRSVNQARADGASDGELKPAQELLHRLAGVLGLTLQKEQKAVARLARSSICCWMCAVNCASRSCGRFQTWCAIA
jgi:cysteinyl-tRNA synthetase